jgi:gluconate 2-dehydrogenase gamma chain
MSISRRDLLKSLSATAAVGSVLRIVPLEAAEKAHRTLEAQREAFLPGGYSPKFFSARQYETLRALCQAIIPADREGGGAIEAGAPEFIDLLTSENQELQLQLGGGIMWLDSTCSERYGNPYLQCTGEQQKEILDLVAFCKNAEKFPRLSPGIEFFATLRKYTADGFFTSKIGLQYLGYIGNTYLSAFPGCPAIPEN